jgi:hypothetical protein
MNMAVTATTPADSGATMKQRLNGLIEKFLADAKEIDPAIEGAYIGYDGPVFDRPFIINLAINLERQDGWKINSQTSSGEEAMNLIERYQQIEEAYNAHPSDDEAGCDALRKQHLAVIDEITKSAFVASDLPAALLALRQALKEERDSSGYRTLTIALLETGLGFFECH